MSLLVKKLEQHATIPTVAYPNDLAYDLYALEDTFIYQHPTRVRTGISCAAFYGPKLAMGLIIKDRSSMALKGVYTHGGVIDPGYRGEVVVMMSSHYPAPYFVMAGDKIAQMIPVHAMTGQVYEQDTLPESERGAAGFGSSGS